MSPSAHQESLSASFALSRDPRPAPCNFWRRNPVYHLGYYSPVHLERLSITSSMTLSEMWLARIRFISLTLLLSSTPSPSVTRFFTKSWKRARMKDDYEDPRN